MIKLIGINNPRTKEGGWEDESGCDFCDSVSSAYAGIVIKILHTVITFKICKGCLCDGEKKIDRLILDQTKHGRSGRVWLKASVLKTEGCKSSVGSNPTSSARKD